MNEIRPILELIALILGILVVIATPVALWGRSQRQKRNVPWSLALAEIVELFDDSKQSGIRNQFQGKNERVACTIVDQLNHIDITFSWTPPRGFQGSLVTKKPPVRYNLINLLSFGLANIPSGPPTETGNVSFDHNFRTSTPNQGVLFYLKPKDHTQLNLLALQSDGFELSRDELFLTVNDIDKIPKVVKTASDFLNDWDD